MDPDAAVLSIHEEFADAIFAGTKRFELRRLRPGFGRNARVFVYVPIPRQMIAGWFRVLEVIEARPSRLWPIVAGSSALTRGAFDAYFAGAPVGFALRIGSYQRLDRPMPLASIRQCVSDFAPPQGYHYLRDDRPRDLRIRKCIDPQFVALAG